MSQFRRQDDRRRRVLLTAASATAASPTAASRNRIESMREARRPTLAYGTRVREGLRGRWFSLVPVERSALAKLLAALVVVVAVLAVMNDATVRFASIERRPAFVSVFQINLLGSLGRYWIGVMYLAMAGAAWMVYQLRRFRNDDFRGNYRLWQWIVGVSLAASVATLVPLLAMLGATVELLMGRRVALSGHDWVGLFLVVGGAVLALRSVAEMWRYRTSLTLLIGGWMCMAVPVAAQWNMIAIDTNLRWSIVTSAPLLAVTLWFAATVSYLRSLYREVRGIERSIGMMQRLRDATSLRFARRETAEPSTSARPTTSRKSAHKPAAEKVSSSQRGAAPATTTTETDGDNETNADSHRDGAATKRRWFGLLPPAKPRAAKPRPIKPLLAKSDAATSSRETKRAVAAKSKDARGEDDPDRGHDEGEPENTGEIKPGTSLRRRWWQRLGGGAKPKPKREAKPQRDAKPSDTGAARSPAAVESPSADESPADGAAAQPKKRRFGLGSMMKRKSGGEDAETTESDDANEPSSANGSKTNGATERPAFRDADVDDDDQDSDNDNYSDDDIDWSSMNKAERRRMRKQLKREGRAA